MSGRRSSEPRVVQPAPNDAPVTLIMLGGGIRFPALVGALQAVEEKGLRVRKVIGASIGSIVGALYASGMTPAELRDELMRLDTAIFRDLNYTGLFSGFGLCSGNRLESWVDARLNGRKFRDDFRFPIQVMATDILNYRPVIFSAASHPDLKVSAATRFSSGVPWVFTCKRYEQDGKRHIFVDGMLMSGAVEESFGRSNDRLLILKVVSKRTLKHKVEPKLTLAAYFREMLNFSLHAMEKEFIKGGRWKDTILLYCSEIEPARFSLSQGEKEWLLVQGYEQTRKFIEYKWLG